MQIAVLHLKCLGYEPAVLAAMASVFASGRVSAVVFDYGPDWQVRT